MLPPCETPASRVSDILVWMDCYASLVAVLSVPKRSVRVHGIHENYCASFKVRGWIGNLRCLLSQKRIIKLEQDVI